MKNHYCDGCGEINFGFHNEGARKWCDNCGSPHVITENKIKVITKTFDNKYCGHLINFKE